MATPVTGSNSTQSGRTNVRDPNLPQVAITHRSDASAGLDIYFELATINQTQQFGTPRSIYVDNGSGPNPIVVHASITNQEFTVPPYAQGYFTLTAMEQSIITLTGSGGNSDTVVVTLYNYDVAPQVWYAPGNNNPLAANAVQGAITEGADVTVATSNNPVYIGGINRADDLFHGMSVDATGRVNVNAVIDFSTPIDVAVTNAVTIDSSTPVDVAVTNQPAQQGAYTDRSIASLSGSSEQLMPANANSRFILISNANAVNPIAVNLTGAAAALNTAGSMTLLAGEFLRIDNFPPNSIITVIGTAADIVTAYEG
jgi:hypothetical protein